MILPVRIFLPLLRPVPEPVLISRSVADALGDRAEVVSLGNSVKLKGKAPDFEVLELKVLQ